MSAFHQITCRGVSHMPECTRLSTWMFSGVCDTPLRWLFADIHFKNQQLIIGGREMRLLHSHPNAGAALCVRPCMAY